MPFRPPYFQIDPEYHSLLLDYRKEAQERLRQIEDLVLAAKDSVDYLNLKRLAHNLKGSAGSYGVTVISHLFQRFESFLVICEERGVKAFSDEDADHLLRFLDTCRIIFERVAANNLEIEDLVPRLREQLARIMSVSGHHPVSPTMRILILDQTEMIRHVLGDRLPAGSYTVDYSDSLDVAVHLLREFRPAVLITSYHIDSYFNGAAFCALVKLSAAPPPATILLSSTPKDQIPGRQFCDHVLRKDALTYDDILRVIRETRHRKE